MNCRYSVGLSLRFVSIICCMGHAMSQIQICFSYFVSSIKSGLLAVSVFRMLNWKSQTSLTLLLSKTVPRSHRSLYHIVATQINLCFFAQVIASIISALLFLAKYSLLDKTVHPATTYSTVSSSTWQTWHLPSLGHLTGSCFHHLFQHWHDRWCSARGKILNQSEVKLLLLFSKESTLLLLRLVRFDFHLFSTFLKSCFHPF